MPHGLDFRRLPARPFKCLMYHIYAIICPVGTRNPMIMKETDMPLLKEEYYTVDDILALPAGERAELIDGQMYMMAAPSTRHQRLVGTAYAEIHQFIKNHGGPCEVFVSPYAVYLAQEEDYVEPDVLVVCDPGKIDDRGCHGAPDWVIEIVSPSSRSMDYMIKLREYQNEGVREYWIVDPEKDRVLVYNFASEEVADYTLQDAVPSGIYEDLTLVFEP